MNPAILSAFAVNAPANCAATAQRVLAGYAGRPEIAQRHLTDLLTDLAHLSADRGWDFSAAVQDAVWNCQSERERVRPELHLSDASGATSHTLQSGKAS